MSNQIRWSSLVIVKSSKVVPSLSPTAFHTRSKHLSSLLTARHLHHSPERRHEDPECAAGTGQTEVRRALAGRFGPCLAVPPQETIPRIGNTLVPYRALVWQESKQVWWHTEVSSSFEQKEASVWDDIFVSTFFAKTLFLRIDGFDVAMFQFPRVPIWRVSKWPGIQQPATHAQRLSQLCYDTWVDRLLNLSWMSVQFEFATWHWKG